MVVVCTTTDGGWYLDARGSGVYDYRKRCLADEEATTTGAGVVLLSRVWEHTTTGTGCDRHRFGGADGATTIGGV